jgi:ABC-type polar amino acid transport system ATPase subunit
MEGAAAMTEPVVTERLLSVRDVRLARGERQILAGVSFDVPRSAFVAIMGASGSGKTTVLRAVAALESFNSGQIVVDGLVLEGGPPPAERVRELRRKVGLVFQFHHLFEHLTVMENVCLAPVHVQHVPMAAARERAHELLTALEVDHRATALPRELSGGEAQRVAIARALAVNPPLLMMDEPTASLDAARRDALGGLLQRLCGENRSILVSTHDEGFAQEWATSVLYLRAGKI